MRVPGRKTVIIMALLVVGVLAAVLVEGPPRRLPPDERIPERIVVRTHGKHGGREIVAVTNREEVLSVMTALPRSYEGPYCACFGFFELEFYAPTGVYRTVSYKPGLVDAYLRDSEHPNGQASVPRRFKRIVGELIRRGE